MFSFLQVLTCSGVQFVPGALSQVKKVEKRGDEAICHLCLLPRLGIFRNMPLFFRVLRSGRSVQLHISVMFV
jgi:hypothetical protein